MQTLEALRRRGFYLGIVSNIDEDQLNELADITRIRPLFDLLLSSEIARSCKPDGLIFEKALDSAGCRPREAFFIGDTLAQDIAGANRAGLRSVLIWHRDDRTPPAQGPQPRHRIRQIPELLPLLGG